MTLFSSVTSKSGKIKMREKKKKTQVYLYSCFIGHAERKSLVNKPGRGSRGRKTVISVNATHS